MSYEVRDSVPGVRFEKDGKQGWVKVVRKKKGIKKKRGLKVGRGEEGSSSESEVDLDVGEASKVVYVAHSDGESISWFDGAEVDTNRAKPDIH